MEKRLQFLLLIFSSQIIFSVVSSPAPIPLGESDHNNHDDDHHEEEKINQTTEVSNPTLNLNVTKVVNETKILGHGGSCMGNGQCDTTKSLTCSPFGQCECDPNASSELFYSKSKQKCVEELDTSKEGSWETDNISEVHDEDMVDSMPSLEDETHESHEHDEVDNNKDEPNKIKKEVDENDGLQIIGTEIGYPAVPCSNDTQCQNSTFGNFSRCSVITGIGSCECYDTETSGPQKRSSVLVDGICYINRTINDVCEKHTDCHPTIKGNAWCATDLDTGNKTCQCELMHYWDTTLKECLSFGRNGLESTCKTDYQCSEERALGPLSRCVAGKCECFHAEYPTVYYDDTKSCFMVKSLRSSCEDDKECEASLGMDSFCGNHTDFQANEKICQCIEGQSCSMELQLQARPGISTYTMIVFIVAGIAMLIGIVLCFVLRKNDRYDVVSQSP